jgi:hypothetical protein
MSKYASKQASWLVSFAIMAESSFSPIALCGATDQPRVDPRVRVPPYAPTPLPTVGPYQLPVPGLRTREEGGLESH